MTFRRYTRHQGTRGVRESFFWTCSDQAIQTPLILQKLQRKDGRNSMVPKLSWSLYIRTFCLNFPIVSQDDPSPKAFSLHAVYYSSSGYFKWRMSTFTESWYCFLLNRMKLIINLWDQALHMIPFFFLVKISTLSLQVCFEPLFYTWKPLSWCCQKVDGQPAFLQLLGQCFNHQSPVTMLLIHHKLAQQSSLRIGVIEAGNFIVPNSNQLVDTPGGFLTVCFNLFQSCWLTNKVIELVGQSFTDATHVWQFNTIP